MGTIPQQQQDPHNYTSEPLPAFPQVANNPAQNSRLVDTAQFYRMPPPGTYPR